MKPLLTCRQLIDFVSDYVDGSLPAEQRREFVRHLEVCPACVQFLDSYKTTIQVGKAALRSTDGELPATVPEELIRAILDSRKA